MKYSEQYYKNKIEFHAKVKKALKDTGMVILIVAGCVLILVTLITIVNLVMIAWNYEKDLRAIHQDITDLKRQNNYLESKITEQSIKESYPFNQHFQWYNRSTNVTQFTITNHQSFPGLILTNNGMGGWMWKVQE